MFFVWISMGFHDSYINSSQFYDWGWFWNFENQEKDQFQFYVKMGFEFKK